MYRLEQIVKEIAFCTIFKVDLYEIMHTGENAQVLFEWVSNWKQSCISFITLLGYKNHTLVGSSWYMEAQAHNMSFRLSLLRSLSWGGWR